MTRKTFLRLTAAALVKTAAAAEQPRILDPEAFRHHIDFFNGMAPEDVVNAIPNAQSWEWIKRNAPIFTCPDPDVEQIYFFRWWTYRKHIKQTPEGFIVTEFLKPVNHAGDYNSLSCALGHHIAEGRWLRDQRFLDQDIHFWLRTGENGGLRKNLHQFSGWTAFALYDRYLADGKRDFVISYLDPLLLDYAAWETERMTNTGLFWQRDVSDGMEESGSGGRKVRNIRPSINSYMYGNAMAIAKLADLAGQNVLAKEFRLKANQIKDLVQQKLWNTEARFFETLDEKGEFVPVRENIGFTPWYFGLPDSGNGYEAAWKQLMDPAGFYAPDGPTTVERRSHLYKLDYQGDDCKWNGPAWPFATTITLRALANVLNNYTQSAISVADYFKTLAIYTHSQRLTTDDGRVIPWVDENQNPETGEWIARAMKIRKGSFYGRGDHYNHSGYCDLVITGLVGLRPSVDGTIIVNPLLPERTWDWFCLDGVPCHGKSLSISWDRTGRKFGNGKGLIAFADGKHIAGRDSLGRMTWRLA